MEAQIMPVSVAQPAPPPTLQADQRPTADTAAIVRDPRPEIPLPIPASIAQKGAVVQARIASSDLGLAPTQRVLKPYGVVMLPQGPTPDSPAADDTAAADADAAAPQNEPSSPADGATAAPDDTAVEAADDTPPPAEDETAADTDDTDRPAAA